MEYRVTLITDPEDKPRFRYFDQTVSSELPEGAIPLAGLAEGEMLRAAQARRAQDGSALGALFGRDRARGADTSLGNLTRGLPSGSVVFEELEPQSR